MVLRRVLFAAALLLGLGTAAHAQTFDNSGNGLLKGRSYFREVFWITGSSGGLTRAISLYGTIDYDGSGNYSIDTQAFDSNIGQPIAYKFSGTYLISASGYGSIQNPVATDTSVFGLVSNGVFVGSSTGGAFSDLFVSAPLASPLPTVSSLKGTYTISHIDFNSGDPRTTRSYLYNLNADGAGNLGNVSVSGSIAGNGTTGTAQTVSNVRYIFSNGAANINFGGTLTNSNLIAGTKYLYMSPDGNFVFGGSPTGWDFFVGVKSDGSGKAFGGLYYEAGVDQDGGTIDTYYGSLKASAGTILQHQRIQNVTQSGAYDYTYSGSYSIDSDGTYADSAGTKYIFADNGRYRIGFGKGLFLFIDVAVRAPDLSGDGAFINPTGVVNAASSSMFTAGLARGQLITLYGTGLSKSVKVDGTFPKTLDGVQVLINGIQAPIYVVSPTQVSAVMPFGINTSVASIQINNNGVMSNTVTNYMNATSPGIFTKPEGGLGYAAALHANFTPVTTSSPAAPGETIQVFLTGLGATTPAGVDGAPGPSNPLAFTANSISSYVNNTQAKVGFAGLAPGFIGLYQMNLTLPSALTTGDVYLDVAGPDSYNSQAKLLIGAGSSALSEMRAIQESATPRLNRPTRAKLETARGGDFKSPWD